ncbi:hypothetical protein RJ639_024638 [Escallonia herrerae]|uniref:Uncharacterized protein n=1 Tax=Escallonia herrerae TaxID=1293975 RepID=A0AA88V265_9ASTE|nr:hypothetical protein RJ639_024638 [Escallonia herrerae]
MKKMGSLLMDSLRIILIWFMAY